LNGQIFLMDWFVGNKTWVEADKNNSKGEPWRKCYKEPRNMLYRAGDLSRYLESSDVEYTRRADYQVKIRGFRIELDDIDSDSRQNPLIRGCKAFAWRVKNEELSAGMRLKQRFALVWLPPTPTMAISEMSTCEPQGPREA
jgi:L-aminoadipate-semialdehyde dehydrogenase